MKKLITLTVCFAAIAAMAQEKAEFEVSYTAILPNMKNGKIENSYQYILLVGDSKSKFYSPKTEYIDSLNSTPEGKAKYQEMSRNAYFSDKMDQMPCRDGSYYVLKNYDDEEKVTCYDTAGLEKFYYEETPEEWKWEVGEETKKILGYECFEATTDYHGRKWTVWFAPDIPMPNGPWMFGGLPGLILEATADGGQYSFTATGIAKTDKPIGGVYLADEYTKTTRKDFLKEKRAFLDNTLNRLNAQLSGILGGIEVVKVEDGKGNDISGSIFLSRDKIDFIETDY